jgi:hypothetical protein
VCIACFVAGAVDADFAAVVTFESTALKLDKAGLFLEEATFLERLGCVACFVTCVVDAEWWCVLTMPVPPPQRADHQHG